MKQVSVIIPVYNAEKTLLRCLNSIKVQTHTDFEVLIINDGSSDNSVEICEEFGKNDERFKLISQKNAGPSAARNNGINQATGKYLMFIDSDDWMEPDAIETFYKSAEETNADVTICSYYVDYGDRVVKKKSANYKPGLYTGEDCKKLATNSICSSPETIHAYSWVRFVKRECMSNPEYRFDTDLHRSEDYLLWTKFFFAVDSICLITDKFLYHYCMTEGSLTHKYIKDYFKMAKKIYNEFLSSLPKEDAIVKNVNYAFFQRSFVAMRTAAYSKDIKVFFSDLNLILKDKSLKGAIKSLSFKDLPKPYSLYCLLFKLKVHPVLYLIYLYKHFQFKKQ